MRFIHTHTNAKRCLCAIGLLLCVHVLSHAQQFSVLRFRALPNDISAYIQPEKDLNDEACALIKVVCDRDFVFSTPLGIVKRKNDVGEVWLYVPKGTKLITIKHPQWGVLRDYAFPKPLESRLTYELELTVPPRNLDTNKPLPPIKDSAIAVPVTRDDPPAPQARALRLKRPKERASYLIMADASVHRKEFAGGLRMGWMRRHGVYVHLSSNFRNGPRTIGECDEDGMPTGSDTPPYYTGKTENSRHAFLAGGVHRIAGEFRLYEGVGYGNRTVAWETNDGRYLRNKDYSAKGISAEAGGIWIHGNWAVSAGVCTIKGTYWEFNIGFGIRL